VVSFPQVSPPKPCIRLPSPTRATCPTHLILVDFVTRKIFGEEYRSLNSTLCGLLHSTLTWSLLGPDVFLSTLLSITLRLWSCRNVSLHLLIVSLKLTIPNKLAHCPELSTSWNARHQDGRFKCVCIDGSCLTDRSNHCAVDTKRDWGAFRPAAS
jgi:hypothetical protein